MTDNLVQRLRDLAEEWFEMCDDIHEPLYEAADRIEAQADALKRARSVINGLLDIASEENLDSEQAGRAYAALHEIGTALAAPEQSK